MIKCAKPSPRTVLDICDGDSSQSNTDEDGSNSDGTFSSLLATDQSKGVEIKPESWKPISPFKLISSFFWSTRKQNVSFFKNQKQHPLLSCFSYQEIANATKNFHIGTYILY